MNSHRVIWFLVMVFLGTAAGLYVGWFARPPAPAAAASASELRSDYRADYTLMVAEAFATDGSVPLAISRLSFLGSISALRIVQEAIVEGRELHYDQADIEMLARLYQALENQSKPSPGVPR